MPCPQFKQHFNDNIVMWSWEQAFENRYHTLNLNGQYPQAHSSITVLPCTCSRSLKSCPVNFFMPNALLVNFWIVSHPKVGTWWYLLWVHQIVKTSDNTDILLFIQHLDPITVRKTLKLNSLFFFIYFHPREPKHNSKHNSKHSQTNHGNNISHTHNYSIVYAPVHMHPRSMIKHSKIYVT